MASAMDEQLERFGARDMTVLLCNGLLQVLPHADPLPAVSDMGGVLRGVSPDAGADVLQRAQQVAAEERSRKAVWVATGLDAGDGILSIFGGVQAALALHVGRKSGAQAPADWAGHQAQDAVLKTLAVTHLMLRLFPDEPDPAAVLVRLRAGRSVAAYLAAAEVALPFLQATIAEEGVVSRLVEQHGEAQMRKLGGVIGTTAAEAAFEASPRVVALLDELVRCSGEHLTPLASAAEDKLPGTTRIVDGMLDVAAVGADILPVYRFLGTRLAAEAAAWRAASEVGVIPVDADLERWIARYLPAPPAQLEAPVAAPVAAAPTAESET